MSDAVAFQEELAQRHRTVTYGVDVTTSIVSTCLTHHHCAPLDLLYWLRHLKEIPNDKTQKALRDMLADATVNNPHRVTLSVDADPSFAATMQESVSCCEKQMTASMGVAGKRAIATELGALEERRKAPQDPNVLPTLMVADIPTRGIVEPPLQSVNSQLWHGTMCYEWSVLRPHTHPARPGVAQVHQRGTFARRAAAYARRQDWCRVKGLP